MTSPAPDSKTDPTSVVHLSLDPELVQRLGSSLPITVVGQAQLPPIGRLLVFARTEPWGRSASIMAALLPADGGPISYTPLASSRLQLPVAALTGRFQCRVEGGAVYVQGRAGQDVLVVSHGVMNQIVVGCGSWPFVAPLLGPRVGPLPAADPALLEAELVRFCRVLEATVEELFRGRGLQPPVLEMELGPRGYSVDTAIGGLRRLGKSAASAATRLAQGGRTSPGRVRTPGSERLSFDDVGGLEEAKRELETICLALKEPELFRFWAVRPPRGILLYGPPGTGKTLLARCLADSAGARFISVRATDVTSKWYGEAEQRVQQAFDWARREAPAVLFFDELDSIARTRDESHEATGRMVSTLLENMDGLEALEGVVVLGATNRPEAVDPALTRPGRFDRLVEVPLPDPKGRRAIFEVHLTRAEQSAGRRLFELLDEAAWSRLVEASQGFSGAEIAETVRRALEGKVRSKVTEGRLSVDDLIAQADRIKPAWA